MKYLGIDYGTKRIGIAVSDEGGRIAFPFRIIQNTPSALVEIVTIIDETNGKDIVLGSSVDTKGEENTVMHVIVEFKKILEDAVGGKVILMNESFTSVEARRSLEGKKSLHARKNKQEKQRPTDDKAAALILQRYLDKINL
ncbi:Holliday junction resolvase RuvX [Candidatus Nomurabacteria bacterium]|nr:MAG: Holliday junction resolvase RuvX [Candidatus Nomurabacteria bacterium]